MTNKKAGNIKKEIMQEIESGKLNMRPRYIFGLEYWSLWLLMVMSFVLTGLGIVFIESWVVRVVQTNGLWGEYRELLWSDFSGLWIGFVLLGIFGSLWGHGHMGRHYKQVWMIRWLIILGLSLFLAGFFWFLDRWLLFV